MSTKILKILCLSLLFISSWRILYAQNDEWIKIYGEDKSYTVGEIIKSYDKGYLLSGSSKNSSGSTQYGLLIKTDINGELLWEKLVGATPPPGKSGSIKVKQLQGGGYIIVGSTHIYDNYSDAFVLKLNACGEKEWSKIFYNTGSPEYGTWVEVMDDGTYLTLIRYWGNDLYNDRIWLFNIDTEGEIIWQKVYAKWTLGSNAEEGYHLLKNNNNEYLITGLYYQYNPGEDTTHRFKRPMFIQIDSFGNEIWHQLWGVNDYFYGSAYQSVFDSQGNIFGVGRNDSYNESATGPVLFKLDKDGNQLFYKDMVEDANGGNTTTISIMDDTTLFIGANYFDTEQVVHNRILKTDTLGSIINQIELLNEPNTFGSSIITFDNKYLVAGSFYIDHDWDIYLWKFNKNLEYDSIYTQPWVYDSLCPYPIVSDTIDLDTTTVNLQEIYDQMHKIKVHPNPASSKLVISLGDLAKGSDIIIYNINSQAVRHLQIQPQKQEYEINIDDLLPGLYVVALYDNGKMVDREKVIVRH